MKKLLKDYKKPIPFIKKISILWRTLKDMFRIGWYLHNWGFLKHFINPRTKKVFFIVPDYLVNSKEVLMEFDKIFERYNKKTKNDIFAITVDPTQII
jgi:hypothetical protein